MGSRTRSGCIIRYFPSAVQVRTLSCSPAVFNMLGNYATPRLSQRFGWAAAARAYAALVRPRAFCHPAPLILVCMENPYKRSMGNPYKRVPIRGTRGRDEWRRALVCAGARMPDGLAALRGRFGLGKDLIMQGKYLIMWPLIQLLIQPSI